MQRHGASSGSLPTARLDRRDAANANAYRYFDASLEIAIRAFGALLSFGATLRDVGEVFGDAIPLQTSPTPDQARASMIRARAFYRTHVDLIDADVAQLRETQALLNERIALLRCAVER